MDVHNSFLFQICNFIHYVQLLFLEDDCHPFFIVFQQGEHILQYELLVLLLDYSVGEEEGGEIEFLYVAVGD